MSYYDLEAARVAEEVRRRGAKVVVIQAPDGLKSELKGCTDPGKRATPSYLQTRATVDATLPSPGFVLGC